MASKRRIKRNACGHKIRYRNEFEAAKAIKQYRVDFPGSGWMAQYVCKHCGCIHIGHHKKAVW